MKTGSVGGSGGVGGADSEDEGRLATPQEKKWKGIAYKYFDPDDLPVTKKNRPPTENELTDVSLLFQIPPMHPAISHFTVVSKLAKNSH
jgi:hypothetical protein